MSLVFQPWRRLLNHAMVGIRCKRWTTTRDRPYAPIPQMYFPIIMHYEL